MTETPLDIQRLERYNSDKAKYTLAIITDEDEDHASRVELEDGQTAWQSRKERARRVDQDSQPELQPGKHELAQQLSAHARGSQRGQSGLRDA